MIFQVVCNLVNKINLKLMKQSTDENDIFNSLRCSILQYISIWWSIHLVCGKSHMSYAQCMCKVVILSAVWDWKKWHISLLYVLPATLFNSSETCAFLSIIGHEETGYRRLRRRLSSPDFMDEFCQHLTDASDQMIFKEN